MTTPLKVHGVDISHHQGGSLDLAGARRRGLRWLYHKATEGTSLRDARYTQRRTEARKAGLPFGAYHFARPDLGDAREEARFFLSFAQPRPGDLRPALDLETEEGMTLAQLRTWADTWCDVVAKATGAQPLIYTPYDLGDAQRGRLRWRPRYNNDNRPPVLPYDIWQFSNGVFGVPNQIAGIGHVDLNVMKDGLRMRRMLIPKGEDSTPEPKDLRLHVAHASMQFSDREKQQRADLVRIFERAKRRGVAWVTGTEAGAKDFRALIDEVADDFGYRLFAKNANDSWIAVEKSRIKRGSVAVEYEPLIDTGEGFGRHGPRGVLCVSFDDKVLGSRVTVLATHYLTRGRPGAKDPDYRVNAPLNRKLAEKTGDLARKHGKGKALVFFGGDQNIVDRTEDTFMGEPLTSSWDELNRYENTGHGNIDVIASYDRDGRVEAVYCRALDDREFPLHTDHFLVESGFDIRPLK